MKVMRSTVVEWERRGQDQGKLLFRFQSIVVTICDWFLSSTRFEAAFTAPRVTGGALHCQSDVGDQAQASMPGSFSHKTKSKHQTKHRSVLFSNETSSQGMCVKYCVFCTNFFGQGASKLEEKQGTFFSVVFAQIKLHFLKRTFAQFCWCFLDLEENSEEEPEQLSTKYVPKDTETQT